MDLLFLTSYVRLLRATQPFNVIMANHYTSYMIIEASLTTAGMNVTPCSPDHLRRWPPKDRDATPVQLVVRTNLNL